VVGHKNLKSLSRQNCLFNLCCRCFVLNKMMIGRFLLCLSGLCVYVSSELLVSLPSSLAGTKIPAFPTIACATRQKPGTKPNYEISLDNITLVHPSIYYHHLFDSELNWTAPAGVANPALIVRFDYLTAKDVNSSRILVAPDMATAAELAQRKGYVFIIAVRFGDLTYLGHALYMLNARYMCSIPSIALTKDYLSLIEQVETFDLMSYDANPEESFRKSAVYVILVTIPGLVASVVLFSESTRRLWKIGFPYIINGATHLLCVNVLFGILLCELFTLSFCVSHSHF
jgi:hypothetical protein